MKKSYGSWESPISSTLIASASVRLGDICIDGEDVYWTESRPDQGGRNTLKRRSADGRISELLDDPYNVRSGVHEYGGGAFTVHDRVVYFSHIKDHQIYRLAIDGNPEKLSDEAASRFADFTVDSWRQQLIMVSEDHDPDFSEPQNRIAALSLDGRAKVETLISGADFYANPRLSPDGKKLSWLSWNHPNMPWDGTELWVADITDANGLENAQRVAGGKHESIFQPKWSPDGRLYFISDRNGWWNLYRIDDGEVEPVIEMEAEFGLPQWVFKMSTYDFMSDSQIICAFSHQGTWRFVNIHTRGPSLKMIESPFTYITQVRATASSVIFEGSSPTSPGAIVEMDLNNDLWNVVAKSTYEEIDAAYISEPEAVTFTTGDDEIAHGFYYPPKNKRFTAPDGELPPLIVICHGGPTAASNNGLRLKTQYWTSRGFAVLDVNYRGSTGYGRAYRELLNGKWGVADVEDCIHGAKYLVEKGLVDENRMAITGGSAGGFTVLAALTFFDVFNAGASYYGVSDLEALAKETHKFEARYLDRMVAPYPENRTPYIERSPIHYTDRLNSPVIFFQGTDDKVVPPDQSEQMVAALRAKRIPVAYCLFEGEGHGFRQAKNIKTALDGELYFYRQIFGLEAAGENIQIDIENLPAG